MSPKLPEPEEDEVEPDDDPLEDELDEPDDPLEDEDEVDAELVDFEPRREQVGAAHTCVAASGRTARRVSGSDGSIVIVPVAVVGD